MAMRGNPESGCTFRVAVCAAALLAGHAFGEWVKVDDFQGYQPDLLPKGANGWVVPQPEVTRAMTSADRAAPGNQALKLQRQQADPDRAAALHVAHAEVSVLCVAV